MVKELKTNDPSKATPSLSLFKKVWRKEHPKVVIPVTGEWITCSTCAKIAHGERTATTAEAKATVKKFRDTHLALARGERRCLKQNIDQARADPSALKVLSFDSTSSFAIINMRYPNNPLKNRLPMPSVTVSAVIDHTGKKYLVITPPDTEKHADFLLTQLYHVLREVKLSGKAGSNAPRLVLHSDSGPENANFAFMSFCTMLIEHGWYKAVETTRLVVGHTHEAIDAFFRAVRDLQRSRNVYTLTELMEALQAKMPDTVLVFMDKLVCFRELFSNHFNAALKYYVKPLYWVFHRAQDGTVRARYRETITGQAAFKGHDGQADGHGLRCLTSTPPSRASTWIIKHNITAKSDHWAAVRDAFPYLDASERKWWREFYSAGRWEYELSRR